MTDRKTIKYIVIFKVVLVSLFLLLILPIYPIETQIVCVTQPCENPVDFKSGIELVQEHREKANEEPMACIEIFDPVCGADGMTYSNSCFADVAGTTVLFSGECP